MTLAREFLRPSVRKNRPALDHLAFVQDTMPILRETDFKAAWWLANPHLQTLWPALLRRLPDPRTVRERISTPDGDFIDLDWCGESQGPIVLLVHGLSGSSKSVYIQGMQAALVKMGLRSVAMNFRGCSEEPNHTARCYHSGDTEDLDFVCRQLRQRYPQTPLAAVGYSLGGNVLLKWLGEQGEAAGVCAAAAVSSPLQLNLCADRMDLGFSRVYRDRLIDELRQYISRKQDHLRLLGEYAELEKLERLGDLSDIRSFWEYDERVVARLYQFADAADYYRKSSSRQYLNAIGVPTLVIQARDDPFVTAGVIPTEEELSACVQLEITPQGGHVGFISGHIPGRAAYWLEHRIPEFIAASLTDS